MFIQKHPIKLKTMYRIFAWPLSKDGKYTDTKKRKKDYTTYGTSNDKANGKRYIFGAKSQRITENFAIPNN